MPAVPLPPDRVAFDADLLKPPYRAGELAGRWRVVEIAWPAATVMIAAVPRPGSPTEFAFRFDLSGYPAVAPTARPWDHVAKAPLPAHRWPTGTGVFASVFRPLWCGGSCLYLPCDRVSANGHPAWATQHPERLWNPSRGIVHYLEQVHALLTEGGYAGARSA